MVIAVGTLTCKDEFAFKALPSTIVKVYVTLLAAQVEEDVLRAGLLRKPGVVLIVEVVVACPTKSLADEK